VAARIFGRLESLAIRQDQEGNNGGSAEECAVAVRISAQAESSNLHLLSCCAPPNHGSNYFKEEEKGRNGRSKWRKEGPGKGAILINTVDMCKHGEPCSR
jgi:hypothetical protein